MGRDDRLATSPPTRRERRMSREEKKREGGGHRRQLAASKQEGDASSSAMEAENVSASDEHRKSGLIATRGTASRAPSCQWASYGEPDTSIPYSATGKGVLHVESAGALCLAVSGEHILGLAAQDLDFARRRRRRGLHCGRDADPAVHVVCRHRRAAIPLRAVYIGAPLITYALMGTSRQLGVGPLRWSLFWSRSAFRAHSPGGCPIPAQNFTQANRDLGLIDEQYVLCPDAYAQLAFLTSLLVGLFQIGAVRALTTA